MISSTNSRGLQTARSPGRMDMQPHQVSQLIVADIEAHTETLVYQSDRLVQSPNWTPDGRLLVVNSEGKLWKLLSDGTGDPEPIDIGDVEDVNNDHVLSPDGERVYFSAGGHLYCVSLGGRRRPPCVQRAPGRAAVQLLAAWHLAGRADARIRFRRARG